MCFGTILVILKCTKLKKFINVYIIMKSQIRLFFICDFQNNQNKLFFTWTTFLWISFQYIWNNQNHVFKIASTIINRTFFWKIIIAQSKICNTKYEYPKICLHVIIKPVRVQYRMVEINYNLQQLWSESTAHTSPEKSGPLDSHRMIRIDKDYSIMRLVAWSDPMLNLKNFVQRSYRWWVPRVIIQKYVY